MVVLHIEKPPRYIMQGKLKCFAPCVTVAFTVINRKWLGFKDENCELRVVIEILVSQNAACKKTASNSEKRMIEVL